MNPLNRIHPLTLVFSTFALLAMLLLWGKKPALTIPPHQVQAINTNEINSYLDTNGVFWNRTNDTLVVYMTNRVVAEPFKLRGSSDLGERRARASFKARMEHVQRLRELAIFPPEEELLGLWDLPEAERERVLQVRREMIEAAVQRMSEASAIEAESWRELRALGIKEPEEQ